VRLENQLPPGTHVFQHIGNGGAPDFGGPMKIGRACRFVCEHICATRTLACAMALAGVTTAAQAADISLDSVKDALPNITTAGVTIYGTIDVGYGFNSHGLPVEGTYYPGAFWTIFGSKYANKPFSGLTNNALEQSKVGVKVEEPIFEGWTAIGKAETGFDPMFGEIADACQSLVRNNGKNNVFPFYLEQTTNGDGSRCGQAFNGPVYAGVSNATFGTVTFGRQQSLELDSIANYDPMNLSYAFSILGYSGTVAGGMGDTEPARWDNSVKYVYQYGPAHVAGMYTNGGPDTALFEGAWGVNAGFTWQGFSIDGVYTREFGAVSSAPLNFGTAGAAGTCNPNLYGGVFAGNNCNTNTLNATITDNEAWSVMAKYTFEFADCCASLKDKPEAGSKLTFYAGYAAIQLVNPRDPILNNATTIGGYFLGNINNEPFALNSARDLDTEWVGARLEIPGGWAFALAYYHFGQAEFLNRATLFGNTAATFNNCAQTTQSDIRAKNAGLFVGNVIGPNCSSDYNQVSFLIDYTFNKYFDVYAGVTFTELHGGLASGFLNSEIDSFASGIRLKF
jgi:predicted porin